MPSRRTAAIMLILLFTLTVFGVALAPLGAPTLDDDTGEFRAFMEPRLTALYESAVAVDEMVSEKSRNILALRAESTRIEALTDEIDSWLDGHDVPAWAEPVVDDYREGSARIDTAIAAAYEAIRTFDFSAMAGMIPVFDEGTSLLKRSLDTLHDAAPV